MDRPWPPDAPAHRAGALGPDLEAFSAYPADLDKPWVQANFVTSLDGAATTEGSSRGLSGPTDPRVLKLIRDLSDVVLVRLATAMAEHHRGVERGPERTARRRALGLSDVPPLALVTNLARCHRTRRSRPRALRPSCSLGCRPADRRAELAGTGVGVAVAGDEQVDLRAAPRSWRIEGCARSSARRPDAVRRARQRGPGGRAVPAHVPRAHRGSARADERLRRMRLSSVLLADESVLLLRYQRQAQRAE